MLGRHSGGCVVTDWTREAAENPHVAEAVNQATAALSALEAAGMVVVPKEPTPAMTSASYMLYMREKSRDVAWSGKKNGHLIYDAMIKAHLFDIDGLIEEGIWRWGQLFNFQEMDDEVLLGWAHDILDDFPEVEQRPTDDVLLEKIKVAAAKDMT